MKKLKTKIKKRDASDYTDVIKRIKPISELEFRLTMVAYGRSGTGKTTFAATFPKPALLLDIHEEGTDSACDVEGIDVLRVRNWDEIEQIYWYLKEGKHKYKSVILDALTAMQDLCMRKVRVDNNMKTNDMFTRRQWGETSGLMKTWVDNYKDLSKLSVIFLCHDRATDGDDEDGGDQMIPEVGPRLMPSVASHVSAAVKAIGNTFIREVQKKSSKKREPEFRMRLGPHAFYLTKVRKPKSIQVPDSIKDPTYDKVVRVISGEYKLKSKRSK